MDQPLSFSHRFGAAASAPPGAPPGRHRGRQAVVVLPSAALSDDVAAELAALGPDPMADVPWDEWLQQWAEESAPQLVAAEDAPPDDERDADWQSGAPAGDLPDGYADRLDVLLDDVLQEDVSLAMAAGRRARAVDRAREWSEVSDEFVNRDARLSHAERAVWARRVFVSELAVRLSLSEGTADRLIHESRALLHDLPGTMAALSEGRISYRHAQVVIDQAGSLPPEAWPEFEQALLDGAGDVPVALFRRRAVRARERLHPDSIVARTKAAVAERRFVLEPDRDGTAWLSLLLPAADAIAVHDRATRLARSLQGPGEERTLAQLRADVARDLLLDGETTGTSSGNDGPRLPRGIRPTVFVTVPVLTLMGLSEEPATLDGYGPIDPETARRLAGNAPSFTRLLTHPETGVVLSMGKTKYKVPKDLKKWLRIRDETCRRPGCGRLATHADIDHTIDWANGGPTDAVNLATLCEPCHRLKHLTAWRVKQLDGGTMEWTTPTGRVHRTEPAVKMGGASMPGAPEKPEPPGDPADTTDRGSACRDEIDPDAPPPF